MSLTRKAAVMTTETGVIAGLVAFLGVLLARVFYEGSRVRTWQSEEIGRLTGELEHVKREMGEIRASLEKMLDEERERRRRSEERVSELEMALSRERRKCADLTVQLTCKTGERIEIE